MIGDAIVVIPPRKLTNIRVCEEYVNAFESLRNGLAPLLTAEVISDPRTFSSFTKNWNMNRAHLQGKKPASDFCEFCISPKNDVLGMEKNDARYEALHNLLDAYRK